MPDERGGRTASPRSIKNMIFDTHAHYNDPRFEGDIDELLASFPDAGVCRVLMPGTKMDEQPSVLSIAKKYDFISAGAGIHPHYAPNDGDLALLESYLKRASELKIVAVGECGLDYFHHEGYPPPDKPRQRELFSAQLSLAQQYKLPVIIHDRDAHNDVLDIIKAEPELTYLFHCFSGDADLVKTLCNLPSEIYISFTGAVTYKKNTALRLAAAAVPAHMLLVETDAPYLAPEPHRGKRCDSLMLEYVIRVLAEVRESSPEEIERLTFDNGVRLFG